MNKLKRLKYGSYAAAITIVAIAVFIVVNLIVGSQNWTLDVTKNKIYSLSEQTNSVLAKINKDINVYVLYIKGKEDIRVNQTLENYKKKTKHLKIQYLDAMRHPEKFEKYSGIRAYDQYQMQQSVWVIFESGDKSKVVNVDEMYSYDYYTGKISFIGEQKFTNAIRYILNQKVPTIYFLQGHGEPDPSALTTTNNILTTENYVIKTVDLVTQKSVPEDADMIIAASPIRDFLPEEISILENYFNTGGRGLFFLDPTDRKDEEVPQLKAMLKKWGVTVNSDEIVEGDGSVASSQDPRVFLPQLQSHEITNKIINQKLNAIFAFTSSIGVTPTNGYTVQSLAKSSSNSWAKGFPLKTLSNEAGDASGPLDVGVAVSKVVDEKNNKEMRAVVFGSSSLINESLVIQPRYADKDLLLNSAAWLRGSADEISIYPREMLSAPLTITKNQQLATIFLVDIFIPGLVLVFGLMVWTRRKHL